jgi:signal transduction histidine kinase
MAADGTLAVALAALSLVTLAGPWAWNGTAHHLDPWGTGFIVAAAAPLAVRRRWPLAVLVATSAATAAYLYSGYAYGMIMLCLVVAVYTAAVRLPPRSAPAVTTVVLVVVALHILMPGAAPGRGVDLGGLALGSAWVVVSFTVGWAVRMGRQAVARDRAEQARRLVYEERLRIAQEVHDAVGHGLAAINMQAEVALHVLAKQPGQAEVALRAISSSSKVALDELRTVLDVVRGEDATALRAPTTGLGGLDDLCRRLGAAGLAVVTDVTGERRDLPTAVDVAAYRIVQEALTNVLRHARTAVARVEIGYHRRELTVVVSDSGAGAPAPGGAATGLGLAGMSARVAALGGAFTAGPPADGGYRVAATLPLPDAAIDPAIRARPAGDAEANPRLAPGGGVPDEASP